MENIFFYFAQFNRQARRAGWSKEQIKEVIKRAEATDDYMGARKVLSQAMRELV